LTTPPTGSLQATLSATFAATNPWVCVIDTTGDTDESTGAGERVTVPVSGGVLVYETRAVGKKLVGFENVDNWDALADALAANGHSRGAMFDLPELDE
jgi:hypothetical protein